eukprot:10862099-Lingulodinium_polyedra.AAC.1
MGRAFQDRSQSGEARRQRSVRGNRRNGPEVHEEMLREAMRSAVRGTEMARTVPRCVAPGLRNLARTCVQ